MEKTKIPTVLYAEITPNPNVMKFVANRMIVHNNHGFDLRIPELENEFWNLWIHRWIALITLNTVSPNLIDKDLTSQLIKSTVNGFDSIMTLSLTANRLSDNNSLLFAPWISISSFLVSVHHRKTRNITYKLR